MRDRYTVGALRSAILRSSKRSINRVRKLGAKFGKLIGRLQKQSRASVKRIVKPVRLWKEQRDSEALLRRDIRRTRSRNGSSMRRPDFIIIGAPKCGTSWLRSVLCSHHGVIMVREEIEFFSVHLEKRLEWYLQHFSDDSRWLDNCNLAYRHPYADCLLGEKSASYCAMPPKRIRLLRSFAPESRLILMIRDPVRRHWAHASQVFVKRFGIERCSNASNLPTAQLFRFFEATKHFGHYSTMIDTWTEIFGEEKLLVIWQEAALKAPEQTIEETLRHIGASLEFDKKKMPKLFGTKNRGPGLAMPPGVASFLSEMFAPEYKRLEAKFGSRFRFKEMTGPLG